MLMKRRSLVLAGGAAAVTASLPLKAKAKSMCSR